MITAVLPSWIVDAPPALLVLVAAIFIELVSWIGFSLISEQLFALYRWLFHRAAYARTSALQAELVDLRRDLKSMSAMDEFAKWARTRRQIDAKIAEYEKLSSTLRTTRTFFLLKAQVATRAVFYLLYLFIVIQYRAAPMFFIPDDWFSGLLGAALSLPLAPAGSVSVMVWVLACRRVTRNTMQLVLGDKLDAVADDGAGADQATENFKQSLDDITAKSS
ncbi:hypothetical protein AMAG_13624 [Allomyces macrogynus ATCC 38327]|uniref:Guided entry of tail-anchored proteins 1 n=1 Tax=Allomyces macrogynus (strain ATCC 38327) TaxID=578462 RepID=A0A0L0T3E6_ALLM3|nr:hypothetical protein AMAG_13624 [Allomyces macrogynus ATCC 38327]|eukprot:KNE69241.1 hypothetical protein AMAG_13624 [Allomyces macrogynus ATCC 38327]